VRAPSVVDDVRAVLPDRLREYVELREGIGQLVAFVSLLSGLKPVMDDWIDARLVDQFAAFARDLGLHTTVLAYLQFLEDDRDLDHVVGGATLNTTRARGLPMWGPRSGAAHIMLSSSPDLLRRAVASGWYPLVVGGRTSPKPWIDHYEFGRLLGYPECCRIFFAQHNDWNRDNTLYQAHRRTRAPSYLCNSLLKHAGLSYTVHLPCSFDCEASASAGKAVRAAVYDMCPDLGRLADRHLRRPYLVLSEWDAFGAEGRVEPSGAVTYTEIRAVPSNRPNRALERALQEGDRVDIAGDVVRIHRDGAVRATHRAVSDRFGPEVPFIVDFRDQLGGDAGTP